MKKRDAACLTLKNIMTMTTYLKRWTKTEIKPFSAPWKRK